MSLHVNLVSLILKCRATPLHSVALMGDTAILAQLIANRATIEAKDKVSNIGGLEAILCGAATQLILPCHTTISLKNGMTTLHVAAVYGNELVAAQLITERAHLEANDNVLYAPLIVAL